MAETHIPRILRAFEGQVWALMPEKLEQIAQVIAAKAKTGQLPTAADVEAASKRQRGAAVTAGATAVIPLYGTICQRMGALDAMSGGCSLEEFGESFRAALNDPEIGRILLRIDSPGGSVFGVEEAGRMIAAGMKEKPLTALLDPMAGSAAYWLAAQAEEVIVTPSGQGGSIGCYTVHFDFSEKLEGDGVKVTVVRGGANKAEGNPYEKLSEGALAHMQSLVDFYDAAFTAAVARGRGVSIQTVRESYGQGRMFDSERLVRLGMADRVATYDEVIAEVAGRKTRTFVALSQAEHIAARAQAATETAGIDTVLVTSIEHALARLSIPPTAARGHAAPDTVPAPALPARVATEDSMSDKDTAAQAEAAIQKASEEARSAERDRIRTIRSLAKENNIAAEVADAWVSEGVSVEVARQAIKETVRARAADSPNVRVGSDREAEAPFKSFGEQLQAVIAAGMPEGGMPDKRLLHLNRTKQNEFSAAATGASQGDPSSLGYVVAPQFSQKIWDGLAADDASLLPMTDQYPVEGESLTFNANAETSRATGSRYGAIRGYWIAEADQITHSKPKLRQVKVEPQELAVLVYLTNKLLRNAPVALEQYVTKAAIEEIGFMVSDAIIRGTGAGQPLGLLNSGSVVSVAKETGQAADTIVPQNISKMWARLHPRARRDAVWLANIDTEPQFDDLSTLVKNVAGTENVGGYQPRVYNPETGLMKGRPVKFVEWCETLGDKGDLILWSPSGYVAGVRAGVESAMSIHLRFDYAESALRFMYEVDGQPWLASAVTPYKGTNTVTTHITLDARA